MKLYNSFSKETRLTYLYTQWCRECGSAESVELHHILHRAKQNTETRSRFNSIPLCNTCHIKYGNDPTKIKPFLLETIRYQLNINAELDKYDKEFLFKNCKYYLQ